MQKIREAKKRLKINAVPNRLFSGHLRVVLPAEHLQKRGWDIVISTQELDYDSDIVWYQEFKDPDSFIDGKKYLLEFDDIMDPSNMPYQIGPPDHFTHNIERADHVIVGNEFMVDRYKKYNKNIEEITDLLDSCERPNNARATKSKEIKIVWIGSGMYDFEVKKLLDVFERIHNVYPNVRFYLWGFGKSFVNDYISHIPYVDYREFGSILGDLGIDIGITHLSDNDVSEAKTQLKVCEYAWIGAPCIASEKVYGDLPIAKEKDHILIAKDMEGYYNHLETLIKDSTYRRKVGKNARKYCKARFNLHDHLDRWENIFVKLYEKNAK